jgi:hypothetical protein
MTHQRDILDSAADKVKSAAEHGSAVLSEAVDKVTPLLDSAAKKVAPVADEAWEAAKQAKRRAAELAADTVERMQPSVNTALGRVAPAVDRAQKAVQDDLLPKLLRFLQDAAVTPTAHSARELLASLDEQASASVDALQGELVKSKKSSRGKTVATVAAVGAVVGALALAIRAFLGGRDDWAAYEPDEPYVYPDDDYEIDGVLVEIDEVDIASPNEVTTAEEPAAGEVDLSTDAAAGADAATEATETTETAAVADTAAEAEAKDAGSDGDQSPYGAGSHVGPNPPEGFDIKGNERSMKYHLPGSAGYARTTGEVWFNSEEAAQAAGFVRSQR